MYINICETDCQSRFDALRQNAQGWCTGMTLRDGMRKGGGREGQDEEHMYTHG